MWSHEISASTGQFTQQVLQQNAYARQINPFDNRSQAEALSGNLINRGVGFAAPIAKFVGGLAGLDSPLSGAMTWGGIGAMLGGPLGAGIGAGVGAVAGMTGAAANFTVGNMVTGMQQQQGLNQMLRQNYGFIRPGGYGFTGADMGMIGSQIRSMSHQVGPGGEMHVFSELAGLAGNMGRMGFSQNITDVRQFTQKFRQMVDTLKTVSKELGTSLQAAQEMVVGMRQSGIFNTADQIKMAQGIRSNNLAGISMEASSQMANVGSQIARSIGGLGRSGAFAGMRTIQQVGSAMKVGALSEEDIYNATGLTGEQGQMAFAQNQLSSSARFLQSGKGRYLLASLAGRGGKLNEQALEEFMSGGFGIGRTRERAYQNLGQIGRADFIRNEGRLRAEVLNKIGGNVNTLALMGWAGERGIDIGSMGDRDMLFAQRMLGMGRDEMEVAVKQANAMGDMGSFMKRQGMQDDYLREIATVRKNSGLEGVKNTFNRFREHAQSKVQQVGQRAYQDVTNAVERQLNKLFGTYESMLDTELDEAYMKFAASGGRDLSARERMQKSSGLIGMGKQLGSGTPGSGLMSYDQYRKQMQGEGWNTLVGGLAAGLVSPVALGMGVRGFEALGGAIMRGLGGKTREEQLGMMRFQLDPKSKLSADQQVQQHMRKMLAFNEGASSLPTNREDLEWSLEASKAFDTFAAGDALSGKEGIEKAKVGLKIMADKGNPWAKVMLPKLESGAVTESELRQIGTRLTGGMNGSGREGVAFKEANPFILGGGSSAMTAADRVRGLGTIEGSKLEGRIGDSTRVAGVLGSQLFAAITPVPGAVLNNIVGGARKGYGNGGGLLGGLKGAAAGGLLSGPLGALAYGADKLTGGRLGIADRMESAAEGTFGGRMGQMLFTNTLAADDVATRDAIGGILTSREGKEQLYGLLAKDNSAAMDAAKAERNQLQGVHHRTTDQEARLEFLRRGMAASKIGMEQLGKYASEARDNKGKFTLTDETRKMLKSEFGVEGDDATRFVSGTIGMIQKTATDEAERQAEALRKQGVVGASEWNRALGTGMYDAATGELREGVAKGLGSFASLAKARGRRMKTTAGLAGTSAQDVQEKRAAWASAVEAEENEISGKSSAELSKMVQERVDTTDPNQLQLIYGGKAAARRTLKERRTADMMVGRGGGGFAAAKWMGLNLDRDVLRDLVNTRDVGKQMGILEGSGGLAGMDDAQKERARKYLQLMSGQKTGDEKLDALPSEERNRMARAGFKGLGAEVQERQKQEAARKDPSYQKLEGIETAIKELATVLKADATTKQGGQKIIMPESPLPVRAT